MIMRQGQQLLLPANPIFIWGSLLIALLLNMLQNIGFWGRAAWMPDLLALVLVFWSVHQPLRVGIGAAFVFGLCMDVHQGGLAGCQCAGLYRAEFLCHHDPSPTAVVFGSVAGAAGVAAVHCGPVHRPGCENARQVVRSRVS